MESGSFRLADEVHYIQRRAADYDSRIVTIGQLVLLRPFRCFYHFDPPEGFRPVPTALPQ